MFNAWGDESESNSAVDPGVYLIASCLLDPRDVETVRDAMTALRLSEPKLHWRNEDRVRRDRIVDVLAELPVEGFIVVRAGAPGDTPQHRRNKTLVALVSQLSTLGCSTLTLESRGSVDDRRDLKVLTKSRQSDPRLGAVRVDHVPGPKDPALWVADALCGVVTQARTGNPSYLSRLDQRVTIEVIEP